MELALTCDELNAYLQEVFPQIRGEFTAEALTPETITMRLHVGERHLRPGGTISGPSMFGLADVTVYGLVLGRIGRKALAVTTNASLDFLRKPDGGRDMIAKGRILKFGRALVVGDVLLYSEGNPDPVARSTMTYSIPPKG